MQAYNSMLVDRLGWECCSQECKLKQVPPPVCIPCDPGLAAEAPAYTASPGGEPGPPTGEMAAPESEQNIIAPGGSTSGASGAASAAAAGAREDRWKGAREGQTEYDIGYPGRYQTAEDIQEALTPVPEHPQATLETTPALQPEVRITKELLEKLDESQPKRPWWQTRSLDDLKGVDPASESAWTDPNYSVIEEGLDRDPSHVPFGLEGKKAVVIGMLLFITETGKTGSVHGELRTSKHATLAEILSMAGVHPDPVSALTLQFAIDNGIYTPKDCDPSFMDRP